MQNSEAIIKDFHQRLIVLSKTFEKCSSQYFRAQSEIFKLLLLFDQQSKTQRHCCIQQRKAADLHIQEAETATI